MVETITPVVSPALAHIIERPRLIERLEEGGGSRVSMFAAPAGYGEDNARPPMGRAAGLSCRLVPDEPRLRRRGAAGGAVRRALRGACARAPARSEEGRGDRGGESEPRALLGLRPRPRGFGAISPDILVIVDEWEAAETPESDELLSMLVDGIPVRWVITTRERPNWFRSRKKIYGEGREIGVDELRMTDEEAVQVLAAAGAETGRARVIRTAAGWPAVLGLAAMSGEVDLSSVDLASNTLDEYLSSELLASAAPETREALMLLAVSAIVDRGRAEQLLGSDEAKAAIAEAGVRGLIATSERAALFFHPLLRDSSDPRLRRAERGNAAGQSSHAVDGYSNASYGTKHSPSASAPSTQASSRRQFPHPSTTSSEQAGRAASSDGSRLRGLRKPKAARSTTPKPELRLRTRKLRPGYRAWRMRRRHSKRRSRGSCAPRSCAVSTSRKQGDAAGQPPVIREQAGHAPTDSLRPSLAPSCSLYRGRTSERRAVGQ